MINSINFLIDNIKIRFGDEICRQVVGNPMGTNCAPLIADLFFTVINFSFNNTYRYLDDIL